MIRSEIGYCVWVLWFRLWDSNKVDPPNMGRAYWCQRLREALK